MVGNQPPLFYTNGALPADYPYYVVRPADHDAQRALQQGKIIYTIAPRQVGKTSLLKRLAARLERQRWYCCQIDLATFRNLEQSRWFQQIGERITRACGAPTASMSLKDQQDFRAFLLDEIGLGRSTSALRLALFFDEAEGLLGLDFADEFLMTLRDLYQQRDTYPGQLLISFAGAVDPQVLIKDPSISPFNIAEEIVLNDFTPSEACTLTTNLTHTGRPVDPDVHRRIYAWTSGHPYLTQRLCEIITAWIETRQLSRISSTVVDEAVKGGLLAPRVRDKNIKHVLNAITNPTLSSPRLWHRIMAGEPVYATESGFYGLYLTGAVTEAADGQIQIRNQIYRMALGLEAQFRPALPHQPDQPVPSYGGTIVNTGKAWAVLVGINTYDDPHITNLTVCVNDVTAIQQVLQSGYQVTHLFTDATAVHPPSRANILGAIASIAQTANPTDLLLFYFSGHGLAEDGESYLLTRDTRLAALKHTAIAIHDLRELLSHSAARARVIILDACHAGAAIGKSTPGMSAAFMQRVFAEAEGMAVLASCKHGQRSWEWPDRQRSVFTYYVLEALHGQADTDSKGFITVSDLSRYVTDRVKHWSVQHNVPQTPTLQYTVVGDIVIYRYR